jgi:hypothetical protein
MLTHTQLQQRILLAKEFAYKKDWKNCESVCSQTIFAGCGTNASFTLYRYWVESLLGLSHFEGLVALSRHILSQRGSNFECVPLSLIASCYSGRKFYSQKIFEYLNSHSKKQEKSVLNKESRAIYFLSFGSSRQRKIAIRVLAKLSQKNNRRYFLLCNYAKFSMENEDFYSAQNAYSLISVCPKTKPL